MHNTRNLTTIFRKRTLLIIVFLLFTVLTNCAAIADPAEKTSVYSDESFYFYVDLPDDWEITQAKEDDASFRLSSISPGDRDSILTAAVEAANNTDIPFTKTVKSWFNDAVGWLMGIIISLLFIGALFLLGTTGRYLRKGIKIKKSLNKARRDALLKGLLLNTNYYKFKKKSTLYIVLPVLFWMSAYGILFMILTLGQFYGSLFVLIAPILGFFGVSIVPSDDLSDYF